MPTFDWTISLGNILTTVFVLIGFVGGAWKFVYNHIEHLRAELLQRALEVKTDLELAQEKAMERLNQHARDEYALFSTRFDSLDKDIRELRDWTIVMRGKPRR